MTTTSDHVTLILTPQQVRLLWLAMDALSENNPDDDDDIQTLDRLITDAVHGLMPDPWKRHVDSVRGVFPNAEFSHRGGGCYAILVPWGDGYLLATDGEQGEPSGAEPSGMPFCIGWYPHDADEPVLVDGVTLPTLNGMFVTPDSEPQTLAEAFDEITDAIPF